MKKFVAIMVCVTIIFFVLGFLFVIQGYYTSAVIEFMATMLMTSNVLLTIALNKNTVKKKVRKEK